MDTAAARRRDLLQLYLTPATGRLPLARLLDHFGDLRALVTAGERDWAELQPTPSQLRALRCANSAEARGRLERAIRWAGQRGRWLVALGEPDYPELLANIPDPPPFLFLEGRDPALLSAPQLAVVGAREASGPARTFAAALGHELAGAGLVVTSGMAYGIDAAAQRAVLEEGRPTIAVHGCGLEHCYPAAHRPLRDAIRQHGLHVSEFPPWQGPRRACFPRRNRIISGLSIAVVVVEAGERSGSLITARYALEQGREVFAVPGSVFNPQARGSNRLLRDGAGVVLEPADLLSALPEGLMSLLDGGPKRPLTDRPEPAPVLSAAAKKLLSALDGEACMMDTLLAGCGLPVADALAALTELELAGEVMREAGMLKRLELRPRLV